MNKLLGILLMLVLVAGVTGCDGLRRYDGRLVAADSLMWASPDSALAIVSALDSLRGEGDRAYRDLLLTQARYKTYQDITAGDDSAVTRATAWYRAHSGEREKLTRAYLYKGAVMQELGHVDSAMYYYKTAEVTADPKDYANLGQINTRIADLYRKNYADVQTCYEKYCLAYQYHMLSGDKKMQLNNLCRMFMMNGITRLNEQDTLFNRALNLAKELENNKKLCFLYELRCRQLSREDSTLPEAKQIAFQCLNHYSQYINNDLLLDLAYLYSKENKLDSAMYFLKNVDETFEPDDKAHIAIRKNEILSIIAQCEGNPSISNLHTVASSRLSDSILNNRDQYAIERIEYDFNHLQRNDHKTRISQLQWTIIGLSLIAVIVIIILTAIYLRRMWRTKEIIKELENNQPASHENLISQLDDKSNHIERLISNLVTLLKSCANNEINESTSIMALKIKKNIAEVANEDFWKELRAYLDKKHHDIISNLEQIHHLTEKDLRFIELICCGFNNVEIAIILGYAPKYVSNKRKILADKLGLDLPLQDHLNRLMGNTLQSDY